MPFLPMMTTCEFNSEAEGMLITQRASLPRDAMMLIHARITVRVRGFPDSPKQTGSPG